LSNSEQADLKAYFKAKVELEKYDRILLFLRFKKQLKQVRFIRTLPNLVELEHDACQNYLPGKYKGAFSKYYSLMPWVRVICSGYSLAARLCSEGIDAVTVPKGFDDVLFFDKGLERDVELAFVGSIRSAAYSGRKKLIDELAVKEGVVISTVNPGEEYRDYLNRIQYFVSADVGFGEYMIKNFEAMACGCVLMTYDQGEFENDSLGFVDMVNVVLFRDVEEFCRKLSILRGDPVLSKSISENGKKLAFSKYGYSIQGGEIVKLMRVPLRESHSEEGRSLIFSKLKRLFG